MKLSRAAFTSVVAIGVMMSAGVTYAATSEFSTPTASKTDTIVTTSASVNLSATGGVVTTIASIKLQRGEYVLRASGDLVSFVPSDYTRCKIMVGSHQIAAVSTIVGAPGAGSQGPAALVSPFSLLGGWKNSGGTVVAELQCWHDDTLSGQPYVDGGATLWAHKTTGLTLAKES